MPNLNHCHECNKPFTPTYKSDSNGMLIAICNNCMEETTADRFNEGYVSDEDYEMIADENKSMALFLESIGYEKTEIDKICVGDFDV
jgi:hypothetical protein